MIGRKFRWVGKRKDLIGMCLTVHSEVKKNGSVRQWACIRNSDSTDVGGMGHSCNGAFNSPDRGLFLYERDEKAGIGDWAIFDTSLWEEYGTGFWEVCNEES